MVDPKFVPVNKTKPYDDLLFALVSDFETIYSKYIGHYMNIKDLNYIVMIFIQIGDREKFKKTYDARK